MNSFLEQGPFEPERKRRIVIVADWLPPDFGAVGQYMELRARALAEKGHDVTLIGLSSVAGSTRREAVGAGNLVEIRLAARPVPRGSFLARSLWTLATDLRLVRAGFGAMRAAHSILFTGSPPFMIHLLAPLRFLWGGRLVYRITDFHPECAIAALSKPSPLLEALLALTNFWRRRIDGFEVLGFDQKRRLAEAGITDDRIALVRDGSPVVFGPNDRPVPIPAELAGAIVLLYSGNYGVAHEVDTVAEGYIRHHRQGSGRVKLWLSATGGGAEDLADRLSKEGVPVHRSAPVPIDSLAGLLRAPHAHLVTLKDSFVGYVMPSKIYACVASKRPIVFVGSSDSDVDLLAREGTAAYWRVSCGDPAGFAGALEELADASGPATGPN